MRVNLSFEEAVFGTKKTINVVKEKKMDSLTAYKIIVGELNPNNLLTDDFFNSLDVK